MQFTIIASRYAGNEQDGWGKYEVVYEVVTPTGTKGTTIRTYEYVGRDIMDDTVTATPEIADEIRRWMGDEAPDCFDQYELPVHERDNQNGHLIPDARLACTELVYGEPE